MSSKFLKSVRRGSTSKKKEPVAPNPDEGKWGSSRSFSSAPALAGNLFDLVIDLQSLELSAPEDVEMPTAAPSIEFIHDDKTAPPFDEGTLSEGASSEKSVFTYNDDPGTIPFISEANPKLECIIKSKNSDGDETILATGSIKVESEKAKSEEGWTTNVEFKGITEIDVKLTVILKLVEPHESIPLTPNPAGSLQRPNLFAITICQAHNLKCSEKDADGYAELKFNGWKDKTHAIDDNNNPVWNQRFYVALDESSKSSILKVEVLDKNKFKDEHIGLVEIDLSSPEYYAVGALNKRFFMELPLHPDGSSSKPEKGQIKVKIVPQYMRDMNIKKFDQGETDNQVTEGSEPAPETVVSSQRGGSVKALKTAESSNSMANPGQPNMFFVTVCQAYDLKCDDKKGADGYVELERDGWSAKTRTINDDNNPVWNEKFAVPMSKTWSKPSTLEITVFDKNTMIDDKIGSLVVDLKSPEYLEEGAINKVFFTEVPIYPGGNTKKPESGRLKLKLVPVYAGEVVDLSRYIQGDIDDEVYDNSGTRGLGDDETLNIINNSDSESDEEADKQEKAKLEKEKKEYEEAMKRLEGVCFKEGGYTVLVHIIEVADLKSEVLSGANDPFVAVMCIDQKKNTRIKNSCNSAVFDDLFYFELPDMKKCDLESAFVRADVRNSGTLGAGSGLIGSFQIDFEYVYMLTKSHEFYRQWVPLVDMDDTTDSGIRGRLLLSVTIIGPGDRAPVHDRKKEIEEESKGNGGEPVLAKLPSPVQQALHFLVLSLYRGTDLVPMDSTFGTKGIDAYIKIKFGDHDYVKSKIVTVKSRASSGGLLSVIFNQRIYIPVMVPCMSNRIEIMTMDEDLLTEDEIVGTCDVLDFRAVQLGLYKKPFWIPIYGATHPATDITFSSSVIKRQNTRSDEATYYRGALLVSLAEDANDRDKKLSNKIYKKDINVSKEIIIPPPTAKYILKAMVYSGSDLPSRKKLLVKVCVGSYYDTTSNIASSDNMPGVVNWIDLVEVGKGPITLSAEIHRIPDIFVYLVRDDQNICYLRFKAKELMEKGFRMDPKWFHLLRDPGVDRVSKEEFPGSILMKLGMGLEEDANKVPWPIPTAPELIPYTLFVYIYQARDLNPSDANGMLDPYVKVRFNGREAKTKKLLKTRNPSFFDILSIDTELPPNPDFWPQINIEVWDWDAPPDPDDWVGTVRLHVDQKKVLDKDNINSDRVLKPKWKQLQLSEGDDTQGQVLVDYEAIRKDSPSHALPARPSIVPEMADYVVEIVPIGLRNLKPKGLMMVSKPYVEFQINDSKGSFKTLPSNDPSVEDPNFKPQPIFIPCKMPTNPMFATCLEINVMDRKMGGFSTDLLGTASVHLGPKMKVEGNKLYKPPGGAAFMGGSSSNPFLDEPLDITIPEEPDEDEIEEINLVEEMETPSSPILVSALSLNDDKIGPEPKFMPVMGGWMHSISKGMMSVNDSIQNATSSMNDSLQNVSSTMNDQFQNVTSNMSGQLQNVTSNMTGQLQNVTSNMTGQLQNVTSAVSRQVSFQDKINLPTVVGEEYLVGRKNFDAAMERFLNPTPFEEYPIYKGMKRLDSLFAEPFYRVGTFKGVIRIYEAKKGPESADPLPFDIKTLRPNDVEVRVYVLNAYNLPAKNENNKSDPYITIKLGNRFIDDRDSHLVDEGKDVGFFKLYRIPTRFPGASKLEISLKDWEFIGPAQDRLIGTTVVDLEDRFYNPKWITGDLWKPEMECGSKDFTKEQKIGQDRLAIEGRNTPTEVRQLWAPDSKNGQGALKIWIDVIPKDDITKFPPVNITPPPAKPFELRVIIWKTRNWTMVGDIMTNFTDLFFKVKLGNEDKWQSTDTHLRGEDKMSFNWRLKYDLQLPIPASKEGATLLTLQAYDFDFVFNDFLFAYNMELEPMITQAMISGESLHLFDTKCQNDAVTFEQAMRSFLIRLSKRRAKEELMKATYERPVEKDEDIEAGQRESTPLIADEDGPKGDNKTYGTSGKIVLPNVNKGKKKKITMWTQIKSHIGLGAGPENSGWLKMPGGEVCISVQILPKIDADKLPAGSGRSEPNANPLLPPPEGRLDPMKMMNPMYALQACVGSGLAYRMMGTLFCILLLALLIFLGPVFTDAVIMADALPFGPYLISFVIILALIGTVHAIRKCGKECGCFDKEEPEEEDIDIEMENK